MRTNRVDEIENYQYFYCYILTIVRMVRMAPSVPPFKDPTLVVACIPRIGKIKRCSMWTLGAKIRRLKESGILLVKY
jgi:hypothetical protein